MERKRTTCCSFTFINCCLHSEATSSIHLFSRGQYDLTKDNFFVLCFIANIFWQIDSISRVTSRFISIIVVVKQSSALILTRCGTRRSISLPHSPITRSDCVRFTMLGGIGQSTARYVCHRQTLSWSPFATPFSTAQLYPLFVYLEILIAVLMKHYILMSWQGRYPITNGKILRNDLLCKVVERC